MARRVDTATQAAKNKRIRQQALREQLAAQGHEQHIADLLEKVSEDISQQEPEFDQLDLQKVKLVIDTKLKLINKYLPDQKEELFTDMTDLDKAISEMTDQELEELAKQEK